MNITKEREELIEMFGVHFETVLHLPPLGSRILAILILDSCGRKISFDDLVEMTSASKSSVSTNLNLLQKIGKINYYTQPGDRKKYFRPAPFSERFENYLQMISFEKKIIDRLLDYRGKTAKCSAEKMELHRASTYKQHVLDMEELLLKTVAEFKKLEENKNE